MSDVNLSVAFGVWQSQVSTPYSSVALEIVALGFGKRSKWALDWSDKKHSASHPITLLTYDYSTEYREAATATLMRR